MSKTRTWLTSFLVIFIFIFLSGSAWLYSQIDGSLAKLNGKQALYGLTNSVVVERDQQGIATIKAQSRIDLAVATGFIHAQERFFQMDLLRRNAAGELSSLFGPAALEYDKNIRIHRFRERARAIIKQLPKEQYSLLKAYTRGVNQGLEYLSAKPFEYLFLQTEPVTWQEEDSILTVFSMYIDLQDETGSRERSLGTLESVFSPAVFQFLTAQGSRWDAALDNSKFPQAPMPKTAWPAVSDNASISQKQTNLVISTTNQAQVAHLPGSNNWAISGQLTPYQSAMVANDMHLGIRVPNTWFRASFEYLDNEQKPVKITGVTLPGTPNMIVGSNTNIAWGFTNSYGDWSDVIVLTTNEQQTKYLTPTGYQAFNYHKQLIAVKNNSAEQVEIRETIWGPVIGKNHLGQLLVLRWVAHDLTAVNMQISQLEQATSVNQAFEVAAGTGIPAQNLVVADSQGNIGWTIMGPIPKKSSNFGNTPKSWASGQHSWQGYLSPQQYPKIYNPEQHRIWTANARVIGGDDYQKLGNGGYALGARSQQIRDNLFAKKHFDEQALLNIALDDKAVFLQRWQQLLLGQVLTDKAIAQKPLWQQAKTILINELATTSNKQLNASADSIAYRLVRNFRLNTREQVLALLTENITKLEPAFEAKTLYRQIEPALWQLVSQQPENFLWRPESSWQQLFNKALDKTLSEMTENQPLAEATWGQQNSSMIQHPLSKAAPILGQLLKLDMPTLAMAGDTYMPRVQGKDFGASERMVVAPGHEKNGIFHMPSSQSGHPWSPFYGKGHLDWQQGKASPFLPGESQYKLTLLSY